MHQLLQYEGSTHSTDERSAEPEPIPWPYDLAVIIPTLIFMLFLMGCFCLYCAADNYRAPYHYRVRHSSSWTGESRQGGRLHDFQYPPLIERVSIVYNPDDQACLATEEQRTYLQPLMSEVSSDDLEAAAKRSWVNQ